MPLKQKIRIYFRPNDVYMTVQFETLQVRARIAKTRFKGTIIEYKLDIGEDKHISAQVPKGVALASGFKEGQRGLRRYHGLPCVPPRSPMLE